MATGNRERLTYVPVRYPPLVVRQFVERRIGWQRGNQILEVDELAVATKARRSYVQPRELKEASMAWRVVTVMGD